MRVTYLSTLYPPHVAGGAELVLRSQAEAMSAAGHDVEVIALGSDPETGSELVNGVEVKRVPIHNEYFDFWSSSPPAYRRLIWHVRDRKNSEMADRLIQVLEGRRIDVVCCHNLAGWSVSVWRAIAQLRLPIVQVLHDQYLRCPRANMYRNGANCASPCWDCRLLRGQHAQASNSVTAVVGVSRFVLEQLLGAGYFARTPIREVLHNFGRQLPEDVARPDYSGDRPLRLGFIGFLSESKGIRWLLETLRDASLSAVELVIAGRGQADYEKVLREEFSGPTVKFLGFTSPSEFFRQVDVAVVPSLWNDTFPSVVYESLGHGVPVLGAMRGGIPEMVIDGFNGELFEPAVPKTFLDAVVRLRDDPALIHRLSAGCVSSARPFYDADAWVKRQERIFESACEAFAVGGQPLLL